MRSGEPSTPLPSRPLTRTVWTICSAKTATDAFFFLEEDYVVAPTIYKTILNGMNLIKFSEKQPQQGYFGFALDTTEGFSFAKTTTLKEE